MEANEGHWGHMQGKGLTVPSIAACIDIAVANDRLPEETVAEFPLPANSLRIRRLDIANTTSIIDDLMELF